VQKKNQVQKEKKKKKLLALSVIWQIKYGTTTNTCYAGIYPDPLGGYNPQFSCDTPNHLKF